MRFTNVVRRSGTVLSFVLILAGLGLQIGCACTKPNCGFAITAPQNGQTLPPGDVQVNLSSREGNFCNLPAHSYDITLDNGTAVQIPRGANLGTTFPGVTPGEHTARANALDSLGRPLAKASVTFRVEAPPAPAPPPPPVVVPPPPPPAAETAEDMNRKGYLKDVFFDFDRYEIRADQRDSLSANAEWLAKNPSVQVTIEGHCDERGTRSYNLALGERRANAAKDYLVRSGVDAGRIVTISYGKDRPFDPGHDETAWAKNRRAHFVVTGR